MTKKNTDNPVVGVDLGGTKVLAGVVDVSGKILHTAKRVTKPEVGVGPVVERIAETVRDADQGRGSRAVRFGGRVLCGAGRAQSGRRYRALRAQHARLGECAVCQTAERAARRRPRLHRE